LLFIAPNLLLLPMLLPLFSLDQTLTFFQSTRKHFKAFNFVVTWEDHRIHPTTQDYADMFGWDEMTKKVADAYYSLTPEQRKHTQLFADNYGDAGAVHHFGKQYNLPEVISLSSSFTLWAPDSLNARYLIYVDDKGGGNVASFQSLIGAYKKLGEVTSPLAREKGTAIFLIDNTKPDLNKRYSDELKKKRLE